MNDEGLMKNSVLFFSLNNRAWCFFFYCLQECKQWDHPSFTISHYLLFILFSYLYPSSEPMKGLPEFRKYFQPVQPSLKKTGQEVFYQEYMPDPRLAHLIYCYWQLQSLEKLNEAFFYRVVADGCMDIFIDAHQPSESYVMGFSSAYTEFALNSCFHFTGIRFLPMAFPLLFNVKASELTNRVEYLPDLLPQIAQNLFAAIQKSKATDSVPGVLDNFFLNLLSGKTLEYDQRLLEAVQLILNKKGMLHLEKDIDTGLSDRQLRRQFDFYIGDSPKTFSKVVRFQNLIKVSPSLDVLKKEKPFYELGYFDQAHFIKEFKTMTGLTPTQGL